MFAKNVVSLQPILKLDIQNTQNIRNIRNIRNINNY